MQLYERLKILRSQFESHENVIVPGPHDTRMTDDEGLEESVNSLKEEHDNILLRDNKSTYMKEKEDIQSGCYIAVVEITISLY